MLYKNTVFFSLINGVGIQRFLKLIFAWFEARLNLTGATVNLDEAQNPGYMFPMKTLGQNCSKQKKLLKCI